MPSALVSGSGPYQIKVPEKKGNSIVTLERGFFKDPAQFDTLKAGMVVEFELTGNKRAIAPGTMWLPDLPANKGKTGLSGALGEVKKPCEQQWLCPYPGCGRINSLWFPNEKAPKCLYCSGPRPHLDGEAPLGKWLPDDEGTIRTYRFKAVMWECTGCGHQQDLYLKLTQCQSCKKPKQIADDTTTFWQEGAPFVLKFVAFEYKPVKIDASAHTTLDQILDRAKDGFSNAKPETCAHCKGPNHGSGEALSFAAYYHLDGSVVGTHRKRMLEALLEVNGRCECGLKAVPKGAQFYRSSVHDNARGMFENKREGIVKAIQVSQGNTGKVTEYKNCTKKPDAELCHLVSIGAGGCPVNDGNILPLSQFCTLCQCLDALCTAWQGETIKNLELYASKNTDFVASFEKFMTDSLAPSTVKLFQPQWDKIKSKYGAPDGKQEKAVAASVTD